MKNARFWVYVNGGPVKLTLKPNQSLSWSSFHRHDEGWSRESETWEHGGDCVIRYWENDGTDCDGRLTSDGEDMASLDELSGNFPYLCESDSSDTWDGVSWPEWKKERRSQRDQYAEMMGY